MSIVCAAIKRGEIAIAADTQLSFGSKAVTAPNLMNSSKLYRVNGSVIGLVGWNAFATAFEHLVEEKAELFDLSNRLNIYKSFLQIHKTLKEDHFLNPFEESDQPFESSQLYSLIINERGLFHVCSYREVNQYENYWAIGSGANYALGALQTLYDSSASAEDLVCAGVTAAAAFDGNCSLPINRAVMTLKAASVNEKRLIILTN